MTWTFTLAAATHAPAGMGEIRFDGAPPYRGRVTRLFVHDLDADGAIVKWAILDYRPPTPIYVHGKTGAAAFTMTGPPVQFPGYVEIPVTCTDADGDLTAGSVDVSFVPERAI